MRPDSGRLSVRQEGLLLYEHIESARAVYNVTKAFDLRGSVDAEVLSQALAAVVERHEALRTTFVTVSGETASRLLPASESFPFVMTDLTDSSSGRQRERLADVLRAERRLPFDLSCAGPLVRARLLTMGSRRHVLVFTAHHIVYDGWSELILWREISSAYRELMLGGRPEVQPPTRTFGDYIRLQREWLGGTEAKNQAEYWAERLAGAPPLLPLPTDRPRPVEQDYDGARVPVTLDEPLTAELVEFAGRNGVTIYTLVLAAWSVLLARLSGQADVVVGVPIANRRRAEYSDVMGYFVNTVAIRMNVSDTITSVAFCRQVRAALRADLAHSELPFERVVERLNPPRDYSHSPIFQTMVAQISSLDGLLKISGVDVSQISLPDTLAMYDLMLSIAEEGDRVVGYIDYATSLFEPESVEWYGSSLIRILGQFLRQPDQPLGDISLIDEDDQQALIRQSHGPRPTDENRAGIVEQFAAQVAERPNQPAVVSGDGRLTYAELDRCANGVARALIDRGVGPGRVVAIYPDRSVQLPVAILGVLKSGAAYLPLDRVQPHERLSAMVGEADPMVILSCGDDCPEAWNALALSEIAPEFALESQMAVRSNDLAYIIYTSGSTGQPKGVAITHASVVHMLNDWSVRVGPAPGEAASTWYSIGFDVSVLEILFALTTGAVLQIVPEELRGDPKALFRWMAERKIVHAYLPPAYMNWLGEDPEERLAGLSLRRVMTGVEPQSELTLFRIQSALPGLQIQFTYGPTEATVYASAYSTFKALDRRCPIGRPLPGTRLYVLDRQLRPVPTGVVGEIYLAGANLADGYLNRPELTEERFLPDPFVVGARMYRTGDLARPSADGNVEFVGRNDDQIKLRGYRIELGEVEAALRRVAGTPSATVLVDQKTSGEKRLVAVIASGDTPLKPVSEWRIALSNLLPDYMIPEIFLQLPEMPLNRNGKLDRNALLAQAHSHRQTDINIGNPRDQVEMALCRILSEMLNLPTVGISDNFFDLGGTSLLAVKFAAAIEREFKCEIPIREVMLKPTIERLAVVVRAGGQFSGEEPVIELRAGASRELVVCVHPAGGTAFCYLPLGAMLPVEVAVLGVQSPGVNPGGVMASTVEEMAQEYLDKLSLSNHESLVICGLSYGGVIAYEMARRLAAAGHTRVSAVLLDARIAEDAAEREAIGPVGSEEFYEKLVRFNGAYPAIADDQLQRYFRVYNHHRLTLKSYQPQVSSARMIYVQATWDDGSATDVVAAWRRRCAGELRVEAVDSGHWEMLEAPSLHKVAQFITDELATLRGLGASSPVAST